MKSLFAAFLVGISLSIASAAEPAKIFIHLCGQVNKPGSHEIPSECSLEELEKAVGGWTAFGAAKRLHVIRFPRQEGLVAENPPETRKKEILQAEELEKKGGRFLLKPGDIIYVPAKIIIGN